MMTLRPPITLAAAALLLCGGAAAQAGTARHGVPVTIVGSKTLPVEVVYPQARQGMCEPYNDGRYFQLDTTFNETANSYDTQLRTGDVRDSFIVTHVVTRLLADSSEAASALASFNTAGATVDPGLSIYPPKSGNLGINFPAARQFAGGRLIVAEFEPDTVHDFSTTLRVRLVDRNGTNSVKVRQGTVSVRGCLMRRPQ